MSQDVFRARASLKARWLAANKRAIGYQRRANEATKEASALQKALDALENASTGLANLAPIPRRRRTGQLSEAVLRLVAEIKSRGPSTAPDLAKALGASYWSTLSHLKRGPFKSESAGGTGARAVQVWSVADPVDAADASVESILDIPMAVSEK
jgi:hypothetical protein